MQHGGDTGGRDCTVTVEVTWTELFQVNAGILERSS